MTKAPERIWVKPDLKQMLDDMESMGTFEELGMEPVSDSLPAFVSYTRTDHALALVAAAYEDAAWIVLCAAVNCQDEEYEDGLRSLAKAIDDKLPDDATAALKARDQRIRNEALREAAGIVGVKVGHGHEDGCLCGMCRARRVDHSEILALITEDQSDE